MGLDKYIPGSAQGVLANPLVIDITYAELTDKIALSALVPGQKYRITDYRTAYNMPYVTPTEKIICTTEPLLVTANSVNTLSMYAYSEAYPQDEIYYNPTSDQVVMPGCDKGYIYRRIDNTYKNDIGFDFRNVKFRRWKVAVTAEYDAGTTYGLCAMVKGASNIVYVSAVAGNVGNALSDTKYWIKFTELNNLYFSCRPTSWSMGGGPLSLTIPASPSDYVDYTIFGNRADDIKIRNNTINAGSTTHPSLLYLNLVFLTASGTLITDNTILAESKDSTIGIAFNNKLAVSNTIIASSIQNTTMTGTLTACLIETMVRSVGTSINLCCFNTFSYNDWIGNYDYCTGSIINYNSTRSCNMINFGATFAYNTVEYGLSSKNFILGTIVGASYPKIFKQTISATLMAYYVNSDAQLVFFNPQTDAILGVKEYTALLSETGYSATSGLLIAGQTYYIASYVAGDDFTNVGGTNVTGNTFVASGTTPTAWTNSSILVSVGISAPAVTLLTNGLSGAIVWTYSAVGTYIGTLSGAFTENKTVFQYPPLGDDKAVTVEWTSANVITVKTYETGALKDGLLVKFPLTIKVYP